MNSSVINSATSKSAVLELTNASTNRLRLYERYGAVAHGVILKIVPYPQHAQEILIDVFASPELQANLPVSSSTTCTIIRLARQKAIDYKQKQQLPAHRAVEQTQQAEHIFNLLFYHNQSPESIAERLQIQRSAVFGALREFFGFFSSSKSY